MWGAHKQSSMNTSCVENSIIMWTVVYGRLVSFPIAGVCVSLAGGEFGDCYLNAMGSFCRM